MEEINLLMEIQTLYKDIIPKVPGVKSVVKIADFPGLIWIRKVLCVTVSCN